MSNPTYSVNQVSLDGRKIIEIRDGKACVEDLSAAHIRGINNRKWFKLTSPILARIFEGSTPSASELVRSGAVCGTCADEGETSCNCYAALEV